MASGSCCTEASTTILRDLSYDISDELEICIKPYKYRIALEDSEWSRGRDNISNVLKDELRVCEQAVKGVEDQVGGKRKLKDVMGFIDRVRDGKVVLEGLDIVLSKVEQTLYFCKCEFWQGCGHALLLGR